MLKLESDLHQWIKEDAKLIHPDLLIIGSEVVTDYGGRIDLLGIDASGILHIIELKRDKTPRDIVAQTLDYASWINGIEPERIAEIYKGYAKRDLFLDFEERFGTTLPEVVSDHSMTIVASALDSSSERIVQYLSERGININAVFFSVFEDATGKLLSRTWLIDPDVAETRNASRAKSHDKEPTGFYFVNIGVEKNHPGERTWEAARNYGFVSAGDGPRFRDYMLKLRIGDRIFAYIKGRGYVGYGIVTVEAQMAKDFVVGEGQRLTDIPALGAAIYRNIDDVEKAEYVVGVTWKKTFDANDAQKYPGIFAIQQVVCPIYDAETAAFLKGKFEVDQPAKT